MRRLEELQAQNDLMRLGEDACCRRTNLGDLYNEAIVVEISMHGWNVKGRIEFLGNPLANVLLTHFLKKRAVM